MLDGLLQLGLLGQQFVHALVVHRLGESHADLVETVQQGANLGNPLLDNFAHGLVGVQLGLLRQVANADARLGPGLAVMLGVDAGHDAQNGRLAGAVEAQQADLCAGKEGQRNVLDDGPVRRHYLADADHRVDILSHG